MMPNFVLEITRDGDRLAQTLAQAISGRGLNCC
jgi:hypothetical protein